MATFTRKGGKKPLFTSSGGELRVALFGPPLLLLQVKTADGDELSRNVLKNSPGKFALGGNTWDATLCGLRSLGDGSWLVYGMLAQKETLEWLGRPVTDGGSAFTFVYQRGVNEEMRAYLERLVKGNDKEERFLAAGTEDKIAFPPMGGCLLRPAAMTNRAFLNLVVAVSAAVDPRMLGWRVVPQGTEDKIVFALADQDQVCAMPKERWTVVSEEFGNLETTHRDMPSIVWHVMGPGRYKPFKSVLNGLFGNAVPETGVFGGGGKIPGAPGWVSFSGELRFACGLSASFSEPEGENQAKLDGVEVELSRRPPEPPREGRDIRVRVVEAVVDDWTDDGRYLRLKIPEEADWSIAAAEGDGEMLHAVYVVPAMYNTEGSERGSVLYLKAGKGDPRTVILTQGGVPVTAGSSTGALSAVEEDGSDIVIASRKTTVSLKEEGFLVRIKDKSELIVDEETVTAHVMKRFEVNEKRGS